MKRITKLDIASTAKVYGILIALLALLRGVLIWIFQSEDLPTYISMLGGDMIKATTQAPLIGLIMVVVVFGLLGGLVVGALVAILYNLVAKWVGGIKIELE